MKKNNFLFRSLMFVPGHNQKLQSSAAKSDADVILLDVEDSVPFDKKQEARDIIENQINNGLYKDYEVFVRLNEHGSGLISKDICQLSIKGITGFLISKTNTYEDVVFIDKLLESIELEKKMDVGTFKLIPILETAASIVNINEIATASKRNVAIGFGSEDFVSDIEGIRDFDTNISIYTPRAIVVMVARAHGLIPIDAAYIKVHDLVGLEEHLKIGRTLGYSGMWVLHPKQNELVNKYYSPSEDEIKEAEEIYMLYKKAKEQNQGVAIINGKFIGPPLVVKAKKILERVELIKSKEKNG